MFAIYDVLDFTYHSERNDWMVTSIGFLDSSNHCTMYVTAAGKLFKRLADLLCAV